MTISDPVGDMFSRIRNAQQRNHKHVMVPSSKFKKSSVLWSILEHEKRISMTAEKVKKFFFIILYFFN